MSVQASQRGEPAVDLKPKVVALYRGVANIVLDKNVVPSPLFSEFKYPILTTVRDMTANLAVANSYHAVSNFDRRQKRLMDAHDNSVVLDAQIELLSSCRQLPKDCVLEVLKLNTEISRGIKKIMCEDRKTVDAALKSRADMKKKELSNAETLALIKDADKVATKEQSVDPKQEDSLFNSSSFSVRDLKRQAIEAVPEYQGIVNNPTDPESPVIDVVREMQMIRGKVDHANARRTKGRRSVHRR